MMILKELLKIEKTIIALYSAIESQAKEVSAKLNMMERTVDDCANRLSQTLAPLMSSHEYQIEVSYRKQAVTATLAEIYLQNDLLKCTLHFHFQRKVNGRNTRELFRCETDDPRFSQILKTNGIEPHSETVIANARLVYQEKQQELDYQRRKLERIQDHLSYLKGLFFSLKEKIEWLICPLFSTKVTLPVNELGASRGVLKEVVMDHELSRKLCKIQLLSGTIFDFQTVYFPLDYILELNQDNRAPLEPHLNNADNWITLYSNNAYITELLDEYRVSSSEIS